MNKYGLYYSTYNDNTLNGLQDMIRLDEMITKDEVKQLKEEMPKMTMVGKVTLSAEKNEDGK